MSDYARRYLDLVQEDYHPIWWKLFNAANVNRWGNDRTPLLYPNVKWDSRESLFYRKVNKI